MASILGLDIGARSVKALLLDSTFRGFTARSFVEAKVEEPGGVKAALEQLKAGGHLAADQVVVAMPGSGVATHVLTMPFIDARRIEATLGFEVESQLPYDVSEADFDYQVLTVREGKSEVLVAAARKEQVQATLAMLTEIGVDPRVITTSALAYHALLATALTGHPAAPAQEGTAEAIIDIGHERTSVCIGHAGGELEYARTFAGGGLDLTRAVAAEFKVSAADAEAWKENEGDAVLEAGAAPEVERATAALLRGLAPVVREIRATLRAHNARFRKRVTRIYLAGGTARLKGLDAVLARDLNAEVLLLDPIPKEGEVAAVPAGAAAVAAQAFALAIRGHGTARAARLNLRKGDFAFRGDLDYLKGKVSRLAAFAAILVLLALVSVWAQFRVLSKREAAVDGVLCTTTQKVLGQCQKDYLVALSLLKGKGSPAAALPTYSALDLLAEVTSRLGEQKIKIEEIEVQLERLRMRGETDNFEAIEEAITTLKKFRCFQEVKRGNSKKSKDGSKVQFDLDIKVACPESGAAAQGA